MKIYPIRSRGRRSAWVLGTPLLAVGMLLLLQFGLGVPALAAGGDLDPSFGVDGQVTSTAFFLYGGGNPIALQADGKIVVAGYVLNPVGDRSRFAVARFDVDGTLDPSFGGDGIVRTVFRTGEECYESARSVVVQADGKIVAVGVSSCKRSAPVDAAETDSLFALARYNGDGTLDTTFGDNGTVMTSFGDPAHCNAQAEGAALEPDGKIVAAGVAACWKESDDSRFAVARYDTDGALDTSFSDDGMVKTNFTPQYDKLTDVAVQPDGKIVEGGSAGCAASIGGSPHPRWALARYRPNGTLDPTFGGDGRVVSIFLAEEGTDWMSGGVAIQPNGKIVAAGTTGRMTPRFTLARYRTNGQLDKTFGDDGKVRTIFDCSWPGGARGGWDGLAIQADRKIVATGGGGCLSSFVMARFLPS